MARVLERSTASTAIRARALIGLAALSIRSGETALGAERAREAVDIHRRLGDLRGACRALQVVATSVWSEDDWRPAERDYHECLELAREAGYRPGQAAAERAGSGPLVRRRRGRSGSPVIDDSLATFRRGSLNSRELAPTILGIGEILVPQPETGTDRLYLPGDVRTVSDVTCEVAVGYALANRGMIRRVVGELEAARGDMTDAALELFRGSWRSASIPMGSDGSVTSRRPAAIRYGA